jgi:hypothetical protein
MRSFYKYHPELLFKGLVVIVLVFPVTQNAGDSTIIYYLLYLTYIILALFVIFSKKYILNIFYDDNYWLIFTLLTGWFYGIVNGVFQGNNEIYIIRNFAGLTLFVLYYLVLILRYQNVDIFSLLFKLSYLIIAIYLFKLIHVLPTITFDYSLGLTSLRILSGLSYIIILMFTVLSFERISGVRYLFLRPSHDSIFFSWIYFIAGTVVLVFFGSKSVLGALLINLIIIVLINAFRRNTLFITTIIVIVISGSFLFILENNFPNIYNVAELTVYLELNDNHPRSIQRVILLNDLSYMGSGLGGGTSSGYKRDPMGYGFELTYLSIIHKYGFFSVLILFPLLVLMLKAFRGAVFERESLFHKSALIIIISVLLSAYGNPVLFHPVNVLYILLCFMLTNKSIMRV